MTFLLYGLAAFGAVSLAMFLYGFARALWRALRDAYKQAELEEVVRRALQDGEIVVVNQGRKGSPMAGKES